MNHVYESAFEEGAQAYRNGLGVAMNPYDQESETEKHEAWLDGWSSEQTIVGSTGC